MPTPAQIAANAKIVVRELMAEPDALPLISACAVAGNGWQENLMQPLTHGVKDHGSDGLLQWRLDRLTNLQRFSGWQTLPVQCRFFKAECKVKYPSLWAQLVNPGNRTLENLTANICDLYERPSAAGRVIDARVRYAKRVLQLFDATVAAPPPPPTSVTLPSTISPQVAQAIIGTLGNVLGGPISTVIGIFMLVYATMIYNDIQIPHAPNLIDWQTLTALGLTLLFGVGGKSTPQPTPEPEPIEEPAPAIETKPKEDTMDPTVIITLITDIVPLLEKLASDIPALHARIAALETKTAATADPATADHLTELVNRVHALVAAHGA